MVGLEIHGRSNEAGEIGKTTTAGMGPIPVLAFSTTRKQTTAKPRFRREKENSL